MLSKLIKYDLKFIYKQLVVFYIIIFASAILARLTNVENPSFFLKFIHEFAQGCVFGFSLGAFINATMRTWARFRMSLYGDEAYLTHTLPVSRHILWASKFLTSLIVVAINIIVLLLAVLILFRFKDILYMLRLDEEPELIPERITFYASFILAAFLQIVYIIQAGYMGFLVGHRSNNNRIIRSVLLGLVFYVVGELILLGLLLLWGEFNPAIGRLFGGTIHHIYTSTNIIGNLTMLLYGISIVYAVIIGATYAINDQLLARGVDVD